MGRASLPSQKQNKGKSAPQPARRPVKLLDRYQCVRIWVDVYAPHPPKVEKITYSCNPEAKGFGT